LILPEEFVEGVVGLLIADSDVDVSVSLADVLEDCFSTVEHRVEVVFTPVEGLLPFLLEGDRGLKFMGLSLQAMRDCLALVNTGGTDRLH
jgi:hypothetical protein